MTPILERVYRALFQAFLVLISLSCLVAFIRHGMPFYALLAYLITLLNGGVLWQLLRY